MDMTPDPQLVPNAVPNSAADQPEAPEDEVAQVAKILKTIKDDKRHHEKAFKRMQRDMNIALNGYDPENWNSAKYSVNIAGRHVKQKTAALYAKNPRYEARRRDTLDFMLWDEDSDTLKLAFQTVQLGLQQQQMAAQASVAGMPAPGVPQAPAPGMAGPGMAPGPAPTPIASPPPAPGGLPSAGVAPANPNMVPPGAIQDASMEAQAAGSHHTLAQLTPMPPQLPLPPGFVEAQQLLQDFQQGMQRRMQLQKFGKTLEILFAYALEEQKPVDFKKGMKQLVRRACTTAVGYLEINFQREYGPSPSVEAQLTDYRTRIAHLQNLMEQAQEGDFDSTDAEMAELQASMTSLQSEPEIILREGIVFDYPQSTKVIPDKLCKQLEGFVGARHLSIEYLYTVDEVKETFGVDVGASYTAYKPSSDDKTDQISLPFDENGPVKKDRGIGLVCVWKHYDKPSGLVYYIADGYKNYLRQPAAPDVLVDDFWPVYALTFNAIEHENELFPPSDVSLLRPMQEEYNSARQGQREHRKAARPRWAYPNGSFDDDDIARLKNMNPFDVIGLNKPPDTKLAELLEVIPVPGVDPNLYETNMLFTDTQLAVGTEAAQFGGISKATATETAIAANSSSSSDSSSVDDLDAFLSMVARACGMVLIREMSPEQVPQIAGPGAVWPVLDDPQIINEVFLEIEAGSTGKPNQAVEIDNWKSLLPFLLQTGTIKPEWLARETLRRLDDKLDLTDAIAAGIPAIVAMNQSGGGPFAPRGPQPTNPTQGGANNGPQPPRPPAGSGPAFGSNQV